MHGSSNRRSTYLHSLSEHYFGPYVGSLAPLVPRVDMAAFLRMKPRHLPNDEVPHALGSRLLTYVKGSESSEHTSSLASVVMSVVTK